MIDNGRGSDRRAVDQWHGIGADDLTVPVRVVTNRTEQRIHKRDQVRRRRRRTGVLALAVLLLLGAVVGGGYYVIRSVFAIPDFEGTGRGDVVVQVADGDSTTQIGAELAERGVVAGVAAFTEAAQENDRIRSVQPGFYQLRLRMSGESAVALLLDPASRRGQLEIRGGLQLDDTRTPDGAVVPGVLSLISRATCATRDGLERCLSIDELRAAMAQTDPAELGVPAWALADVRRADPARRLEGLLVPGRYDVEPGAAAAEVLRGILVTSVARLEASGLESGAQSIGITPYQVLVIASLAEKEGTVPDMPKIARVVYNRLGAGQRLQLDTTINYPLDLQGLYTTDVDRGRPGPYNTYLNTGLPPTPIATAGKEAIAAAISADPGPWLFFVPCRKDGTACFAVSLAEHEANIATAKENGAI